MPRKVKYIQVEGYWYIKVQMKLFWIIPLPIYRYCTGIYNDIVLGTVCEPAHFETKEQAEKWYNSDEIYF